MFRDKSLVALCLVVLEALTVSAQASNPSAISDGNTVTFNMPPGKKKRITDLQNVVVNTDAIERIVNRSRRNWRARTIKKFKNKMRRALKGYLGALMPDSLEIPKEFRQAYGGSTDDTQLQTSAFVASAASSTSSTTTATSSTATTNNIVLLDLRENYRYCSSIRLVRDQSNCGSCWAFVTANTISDRFCIAKGSTRLLSAQDILECCVGCLLSSKDNCGGGYVHLALHYMRFVGACTGETFNDFTLCKPYFMDPSSLAEVNTIPCRRSCTRPRVSTIPYSSDRLTILNYHIFSGEAQIINHLQTGGTVILTFDLYEDFLSYLEGVYEPITGQELDVHSIRVIGYGIQNGIPYWLCVNSWGTEWGDSGTVKIRRGINTCNIETYSAFAPIIR